MDQVERARELFRILEGKEFGQNAAEVARRNFCIQELLTEN